MKESDTPPEWRQEKVPYVVQSQCSLLTTDLDVDQKCEVSSTLQNALKLLCDSITAGTPDRMDCWTQYFVALFIQQPDKCAKWFSLLDDAWFKPECQLLKIQGIKKGAPMGALFRFSDCVTQLAGAGCEIRELALHLRTGGIPELTGAASK